jgi:hypothetical protein
MMTDLTCIIFCVSVSGDVITVYEKLGDGWWSGVLNGHSGIFPSTYVEEMN